MKIRISSILELPDETICIIIHDIENYSNSEIREIIEEAFENADPPDPDNR